MCAYTEQKGDEIMANAVVNPYSEITSDILELSQLCMQNSSIDPELYTRYQVNRGLRDLNGNGVLTGLTEISDIQSHKIVRRKKGSLRR